MALRIRRSTVAAGAFLLAVVGLLAGTLWYSPSTSTSPAADALAGIDFSSDQAANYAASQLGQKLLTDLPPLAGYASLEIVSYGIEVDFVGPPSEAVRAVIAKDESQYQGKPIPVRYRSVRHSYLQLQAVVRQIEVDVEANYWQRQGIQLSSWGIGLDSKTGRYNNTVQISLDHYTKAYRDALIARYGSELITVIPQDEPISSG